MQNAVVIYDKGREIGVHYKTHIAGCTANDTVAPPPQCRPWRDETRLLVRGSGIETWKTRLGTFAIFTCSENMESPKWLPKKGAVDFILSPYNCEDNGGLNTTFPCSPGEDPATSKMEGCNPQPTCNVREGNAANSREAALPSLWANRNGFVYEGTHYITNLGSAGITASDGTVVAATQPGVENVLQGTLAW